VRRPPPHRRPRDPFARAVLGVRRDPVWTCPNTPQCPHPGLLHDIEDLEDQRPTCCVDGCDCGKTQMEEK
jgi:hypothetical protein